MPHRRKQRNQGAYSRIYRYLCSLETLIARIDHDHYRQHHPTDCRAARPLGNVAAGCASHATSRIQQFPLLLMAGRKQRTDHAHAPIAASHPHRQFHDNGQDVMDRRHDPGRGASRSRHIPPAEQSRRENSIEQAHDKTALSVLRSRPENHRNHQLPRPPLQHERSQRVGFYLQRDGTGSKSSADHVHQLGHFAHRETQQHGKGRQINHLKYRIKHDGTNHNYINRLNYQYIGRITLVPRLNY